MGAITLSELVAEMERRTSAMPIETLVDRLGRLDVTDRDLAGFVRFGDDAYRRNLVHLGTDHAALVLCWRSGQASPIHDHRGSACALRVIRGVASERRYVRSDDGRLSEVSLKTYREGAVCGTYDADIHTMFNDQPAGVDLVTLHVYTPPMLSYRAYSLDGPEVRECADQEVLAERRRRASVAPERSGAGLDASPG